MNYSDPTKLGILACPGGEVLANQVIRRLGAIYRRRFDRKTELLAGRYHLSQELVTRKINFDNDIHIHDVDYDDIHHILDHDYSPRRQQMRRGPSR